MAVVRPGRGRGIGTSVLFTIGSEELAQHARVAPVVIPRDAGVAVRF